MDKASLCRRCNARGGPKGIEAMAKENIASIKVLWGLQVRSEKQVDQSTRQPPPYLFGPSVEAAEVKEFVFADWAITATNGTELALFRPRGTLYRAPHS